MIFRLALRELIRSWKFSLFFIFNLSLGLTGFVALESFESALNKQLALNAKSILSADLSVSARRELTADELLKVNSVLPNNSLESKVYEFFAMLNSEKGSRLVLIKAIDQNYPLYGNLELQSGVMVTHKSVKQILNENRVWIYPELQSQLNLIKGDKVKLGSLEFEVSDFIKKDNTQTFRAATLAPRVFIDKNLLSKSGLLQYGSTFSLAHLYKLPDNFKSEDLKLQLFKALPDPQINIETAENAGEDSGKQLKYLSDYLGLVAIIALFMSGLGTAYLYRLFIFSRLKEIAILRTLGLQSLQAISVYILQAFFLGLCAVIPTLFLSFFILPFLSQLLSNFIPFEVNPQVSMESFFVCVLMATFGSFFISLPFLIKIFDLNAAKLFNEEKFESDHGKTRRWTYLPAILLFYLLSVSQAHSWTIGSIFSVSMVIVVLLLVFIGFLFIKIAGHFTNLFSSWYFKFSFISLARRAGSSLSIFVALGLGALLINILPQLKNSLQTQFKFEGASKVPSLFMFDIQDEQLLKIEKTLATHQIIPLGVSPLIRARITKVNGDEYERKLDDSNFKTREAENEARFRNRGVNLSYRKVLSDSENIIEGRPFSGTFDSTSNRRAELSIETRFADRMGFKLGDIITFDVQGLEVIGEIVNIRKVKWISFQPNFFILFQDGVLNDAPKTYIAALPFLTESNKIQIQNEISNQFSNVSIVDVARTVDQILTTAEKMSWSLELMAALALLTGYIVLFSIVQNQISLRRWELNMLKILGASWSEVTRFILIEFAFLSFLASIVGASLSVLVSYSLNKYIFDGDFSFILTQPLSSVIMITCMSLIISFIASYRIVSESSLLILRE